MQWKVLRAKMWKLALSRTPDSPWGGQFCIALIVVFLAAALMQHFVWLIVKYVRLGRSSSKIVFIDVGGRQSDVSAAYRRQSLFSVIVSVSSSRPVHSPSVRGPTDQLVPPQRTCRRLPGQHRRPTIPSCRPRQSADDRRCRWSHGLVAGARCRLVQHTSCEQCCYVISRRRILCWWCR